MVEETITDNSVSDGTHCEEETSALFLVALNRTKTTGQDTMQMRKSDRAKLNKPESSVHLQMLASYSRSGAAEFIYDLLLTVNLRNFGLAEWTQLKKKK